ncbi:MAG: ImmA/IrrE family metallo-endopeptidase [Oscillospiraceae bacterium]|nr:ImmA/IrrE family metallo-endopeptidase [Oscillospiraceae bacterium]
MNPEILRAKQLARELLLSQKSTRLPVSVERLSFDRSVLIDSLEHYCVMTGSTVRQLCAGNMAALKDGCTLVRQRGDRKVYVILYNARANSVRRQSFTLAHEVGHIYLEHEDDDPESERQADAFAAELLLPQVLAAKFLGGLAVEADPVAALAQTFAVSQSMARQRLLSSVMEANYTAQEKELLARYEIALPCRDEPTLIY